MSLVALYDLPAPAKLNLFLHLVGRRADGYHLLESLFVLIDWCDTLHLERRDDGKLHRHDLGETLPEDDLCLRAARALQQASGCPLGADIHILKRVPWGAGLGGGSSDAATVLLGLNRLWGLGWPRARLLDLGERLGADVPFFLGGRNAWVRGIGERLTPLEIPAGQRFAVLKPPVALPTPSIFRHAATQALVDAAIVAGSPAKETMQGFSAGAATESSTEVQSLAKYGVPPGPAAATAPEQVLRWLEGEGRNDLQPAAEALASEVTDGLSWLQARYGNSRMTGSGSAVFARAGTVGAPLAIDPKVPQAPNHPASGVPEGWVFRECRSLASHPLVAWAD
ncbi:MAG: 4-(cytidine 5'-diphospho)-2-C-methyl-D-erythritol kinase [Rubrivivax sp.]|jgi:4-diphosphocytidyl-2-C-methyl-D-erythritol kinase